MSGTMKTDRSFRERVGTTLLRAGTELAYDRKAFERSLGSVSAGAAGRNGAYGAVEMARWVDSAVRWLGMRVTPATIAHVL